MSSGDEAVFGNLIRLVQWRLWSVFRICGGGLLDWLSYRSGCLLGNRDRRTNRCGRGFRAFGGFRFAFVNLLENLADERGRVGSPAGFGIRLTLIKGSERILGIIGG